MRFVPIVWLALTLAIGAPSQGLAQDQTLADIRQELNVLYVEIQRLKRELSTTGGVAPTAAAQSQLERINQIETALVHLTSKTEQLENRINRVVNDGTNRIGDLEFRLVELEGGDISQLGETTTLGGGDDTGTMVAANPDPETGNNPELAMGEQGDFDRAKAALDAGNLAEANRLFAEFTDTYTGGPLTGDAHFYRGEALAKMGETADAARAYLESFSGSPASARAPQALFGLGVMLGKLGQTNEACVSLREVGVRFPGAEIVVQAQTEMQNLNCP